MPHSPPLSPAIKYRLLLTFQPPRQLRHSFLRLYIYSLANYRFQTGSTMRAEFTGKNRDTAHASAGRCRNSSAVRALNLKPLATAEYGTKARHFLPFVLKRWLIPTVRKIIIYIFKCNIFYVCIELYILYIFP